MQRENKFPKILILFYTDEMMASMMILLILTQQLIGMQTNKSAVLAVKQDLIMMRPTEFENIYGEKCTNGSDKNYLTTRYQDSLNQNHSYAEFCFTSEESKVIVFDKHDSNETYAIRATCPRFEQNSIVLDYARTFRDCNIDTMKRMLVTFQQDMSELYEKHDDLLSIYLALLCVCLRIVITNCQTSMVPELTNRILNMILARLTGIEAADNEAPYEGIRLVQKINDLAQMVQDKIFITALITMIIMILITFIPIRIIATRGNSIFRNTCGVISKLCEIQRFFIINVFNFPLDNPTIMNWNNLWRYINESWWQTKRTPDEMAIQMTRARIFESPCLSCAPLNVNERAIAKAQNTQDKIMASEEVKTRIGITVNQREADNLPTWPNCWSRLLLKTLVRLFNLTSALFAVLYIISWINDITIINAAETMILLIKNRKPVFKDWLNNINTM